MAGIYFQLLDEPVVERAMDIEFQSADRVSDILDRVALAMSVVIHRIDAPFVACAMMMSVKDAIHDRVAEHHVGVSHIDLGAEHLAAVLKLASAHAAEEVEVFLYRAVAVRAVLSG